MIINYNKTENPLTFTTLFIIPMFKIPINVLQTEYGFKNAYLKNVHFDGEDYGRIIHLLFQPDDFTKLDEFSDTFSEFILDDKQYNEEGSIIISMKIPEEWNLDFDYFVCGKYSKMSDKYRELFIPMVYSGKHKDYEISYAVIKVVNKLKELRKELEITLGINMDEYDNDNFEYCSRINMNNETLDFSLILK